MTVLQNVTLAPRKIRKLSKKQANERAYELLERIGLQDKATRTPTGSRAASSSASRSCARSPWTRP